MKVRRREIKRLYKAAKKAQKKFTKVNRLLVDNVYQDPFTVDPDTKEGLANMVDKMADNDKQCSELVTKAELYLIDVLDTVSKLGAFKEIKDGYNEHR